jgi:uncharacterized protein YjaG (DUF416 family)
MVKFDRDLLKDRLQDVGPRCRALFAVAIAERLFPLYQAFSEKTSRGRPNYLRSTLDHLWELVLRGQTGQKEPFLSNYEPLIPGEDTDWTPLNPLAENAVASLAYACQCQLTGETEGAVWAATQGYEVVDYIAHTLGGVDFAGPEAEAAILKSEYVQDEIERQLCDLSELEKVAGAGSEVEDVVKIFRDRARFEGMRLAPVASALWPGG